jgi:hypothetical protein
LHPFSISFTPFCSSLKSPPPPSYSTPLKSFFPTKFFLPSNFCSHFFLDTPPLPDFVMGPLYLYPSVLFVSLFCIWYCGNFCDCSLKKVIL